MSSYPPPLLVLDLDILSSQPAEDSSRSIQASVPGSSDLPFPQPSAPIHVHHIPQLSGPVQWILKVAEVPQELYNQRRQSGQSNGPFPSISFGSNGYSVWSALEAGDQDMKDLANYNQIAFEGHKFKQKLSWRFLFKGLPTFEKQFNVSNTAGKQPTIQRMVVQTAKALRCFKGKQPQFRYNLYELVILEIALVSRASVQATIGVMTFEAVNQG